MVFQLDCLVLRSAKSILSGSMLGKQIVSRAACRLLESRAEGITQTGIVVGTVEAPRRERAVGHAEETHGDRRAADVGEGALVRVRERVEDVLSAERQRDPGGECQGNLKIDNRLAAEDWGGLAPPDPERKRPPARPSPRDVRCVRRPNGIRLSRLPRRSPRPQHWGCTQM